MNQVSFIQAVTCMKMKKEEGIVNLTEADYEFLTRDKMWTYVDRATARRCLEACIYGALDLVGMPRFPAPAEFIAGAIALYVHPCNIQMACSEMGSVPSTDTLTNGLERLVSPELVFATVVQIQAGQTERLEGLFEWYKRNLPTVNEGTADV